MAPGDARESGAGARGRGWRRLVNWLRGPMPDDASPALPAAAPEPAVLGPKEELWLGTLAEDLGEGRRQDAIASSDFWSHIDSLWQSGHERLALEWLEKLITVPAVSADRKTALRVRLVELYDKRGELGAAVPHLDALAQIEDRAARAHFLLAEHHRRTGDEPRAMRHYQAVLALDVDYPNARTRLERLRARRGDADTALPGATIAGADSVAGSGGARYRLLREIGRGATGVVYLARDTELDRDVAVKLLHPHLASVERAGALARFFTEARLAASLRHPNIVAILDLDEDARRIVMELGAGGTLRQLLRGQGPMDLYRALERHLEILSALGAAHRRGIVHRDVKPGNLMFRRAPDAPGSEVMLGDFGVAHLPEATGALRTDAEKVRRRRDAVGTLAYMAPEQRKTGEATQRSDLYSSAVVLYEMLTGRYPWPPHILLGGARRRGDFQLPTTLREGAPSELVQAVQAHLDALGDPTSEGRPDTDEAVRVAGQLRDHAVAEAR